MPCQFICFSLEQSVERETGQINTKMRRNRCHDPIMVVALRQAGDGDCADGACASKPYWKRAAMRGVVGLSEVPVGQRQSGERQFTASAVGRFMQPPRQIELAAHPVFIIRSGTGAGEIEELAVPERDVDDDGNIFRVGPDFTTL